MTRNEMLEFVRQMMQSLNEHDIEKCATYWQPDMTWYGPGGWGVLRGIEAFKEELLRPFFQAFPDFQATFDVWAVDAEQEMVVAWGYYTATHRDVFLGVPASGKVVTVGLMDLWKFRSGKLAENWAHVDTTSFLQQVGVVDTGE
jgi:steroid delta-isomerase-like uncharacterized protein